MKPANNLGYLIQHVAAVMAKQADQALQEQLGIGLSQFKILMVLQKNDRVQQRFIADSLGQTEASISRQIQLLQDKDLLTSKCDPKNRRQHITVPTPAGLELTKTAMQVLSELMDPELAHMGQPAFEQLLANLHQLHQIVCQPGKTGACDHQFKTS
ncbi:MAG: MarR family winged helix-turn-helix transcriptional regulator [Patescibacteria group bacterium]|nr:MarR family winged helix-turn-helix transcriptional regulator [Patescibacteria group bacterium]